MGTAGTDYDDGIKAESGANIETGQGRAGSETYKHAMSLRATGDCLGGLAPLHEKLTGREISACLR